MELFYSKSIDGKYIYLDEAESHHCTRVLRYKEGDPVKVMDGKGSIYTGVIEDMCKKVVKIRIESHEEFERERGYLHIAVALTKNSERYEWFLEKATEIGVDEITPLVTDHSERKTLFKPQRVDNILISASKQSLKHWIPKFNEISSVRELIDRTSDFRGVKLIGYCGETDQEKSYIMDALRGQELNNVDEIHKRQVAQDALMLDALILIGPEGDFSAEEVNYALNNGFRVMTLSNTRLRVETAALMAVSAFSLNMFSVAGTVPKRNILESNC